MEGLPLKKLSHLKTNEVQSCLNDVIKVKSSLSSTDFPLFNISSIGSFWEMSETVGTQGFPSFPCREVKPTSLRFRSLTKIAAFLL